MPSVCKNRMIPHDMRFWSGFNCKIQGSDLVYTLEQSFCQDKIGIRRKKGFVHLARGGALSF